MKMLRYLWDLAKASFAISTSVMLVYRSNVIFFLIFESLFLFSQFLTISVGFDLAGGEIAGWSRQEAYLLTAVSGLSHQIFIVFFINPIFNLATSVWNGQLDYVLLKPIHPLLSIFFVNGQMVTSNVPNAAINLGLVGYFLYEQNSNFTFLALLSFMFFILVGLAVRVGLALLCMAPVFFSERLIGVEESFWSLSSLGRYPLSVYPIALQRVLTFIVPLGMMASLPASALFGKESLTTMLGALVVTILFVILTIYIFLLSLRRYQSVNSGI